MDNDQIAAYLKALIGLRLTMSHRAADLRSFHFGPLRNINEWLVGAIALHIQCPWRIEGSSGIITGRSDLWEPADASTEIDLGTWDYDTHANLQDKKLAKLLECPAQNTLPIVNHTDLLVVESVQADMHGGLVVILSGGYRLVVFPAGVRGEHWRCFQPDTNQPHLVSEYQSISLHP